MVDSVLLSIVCYLVQSLVEVKRLCGCLLEHTILYTLLCILVFTFLVLVLHETIKGGSLQVVSDQALLIRLVKTIIKIFADEDIFLDCFTI